MMPTRPPVIPGVSDEPAGPPPFMQMLAELLAEDPEAGSAAVGRDVVSKLEDWARQDPRLAPKITKLIDDIEGWGPTNDEYGSQPPQQPRVNDLTGPGDLKSPV